MKQNHQRSKRSWKLFNTIGLSLLGSLVVATTASALTLDSSITRAIPMLQKLLITQDGDLSSTAIVELSGTDGKAIKIYPSLGSERVLLAPAGNVVRSDKIT